MQLLKKLVVGFFFLVSFNSAKAQTDTLFWFAAPDLQQAHADRPIFLRVSTTDNPALITVTQPANPAFPTLSFFVAANSTQSYDLTPYIIQIENAATNGVSNKGLLVKSDRPITCYYDIANTGNGDMYALKGENALGIKFTVPFQMDLDTWRRNDGPYLCEFIILATENNTTIEITPTRNLVGNPAGSTFTIRLNRGETYVCTASSDLSTGKPGGTLVKSNKPIAITTKDDSISIPGQFCGDTAGDQLIPDRLAGTEFVLLKGYFNISPDLYYVFATEDGTTIQTSDGRTQTFNAGDFFSGKLSLESVYITSNKPVQVFQISGFGCEIGGAVIPSLKCTGSTQVTAVRATAGTEQFYVNVLSTFDIINDFTINGSNALIGPNSFSQVPGTNGKWGYVRITIPSSVVASGQSIIIKNNSGKFHVGIIQGGPSSTARFGYFSDFSTNTILLRDPDDPSNLIRDEKIFCYNTTVGINAFNSEPGIVFSWIGPNGYSSNSSNLSLPNYNYKDTGLYTITASGAGCGTSRKTVKLIIDKPTAKFNYTTNGCAEDGIDFSADPSTGVNWKWNFGTGTPFETSLPDVRGIVLNRTGFVPVSVAVASTRGCFSPDSTVLIELTDRPLARFNLPASTCVDSLLTLTDASSIVSGNLTKWKWNTDNGSGFVLKNDNSPVTASFNTWGTKDVRLVVQSQTGCESDTFRIAGGFKVNPLPEPGFVLPEICLDDALAQFIDTTKSPDGYNTFTYQWNFNDGFAPVTPAPIPNPSAPTAKDPLVEYRAIGRYSVTQTVNSRGCIATKTLSFKVNGANPVPRFDILAETGLCSNDFISIVNQSTIDLDNVTRLEILWDAADPTLRTIDENPNIGKQYQIKYPDFQSPASKNLNIRLIAYSGEALACRKTLEKPITLFASPKVTFLDMPGICIETAPRQITEASADPLVPGTFMYTGTGVNPTGLFNPAQAGAGTHAIKYVFTSSLNTVCKDSVTKDIIVWPRPIADFTITPIQCEKTPLTFSSTSLPLAGIIDEWSWNFGDGNPSQIRTSGLPFDYIFNQYQTFNVDLRVTTNNGCTSLVKTMTIDVNPNPIPNFTLPKVCLPEGRALFVNNTTIPSTGNSLSYNWNFGDPFNNTSSAVKDGLHFYRSALDYTVKLIALNPATGCKDSLTQLLETVYEQPKAGFISKDSICIGETLEFTDTSKTKEGTINKWFWRFDGITTDTMPNTSHFYRRPGIETIVFFAQNDLGCYTDTIRKTIEIFDAPKIDAGPDLFVINDGSVKINATATGRIVSYSWTPSSYLSATNILQPIVVNPQTEIEYRLTVLGRGGCIRSDIVKMKPLFMPLPPNTFTPNGDGINDTWVVKNLEQYPEATIEVYTTSGTLVFRNVGNSRQWDGIYKGKPLPTGTYYYVIDPKNSRQKIAGYITLLK
jgi:gliding motility-associated-like protein